jgi:hypothetical protein
MKRASANVTLLVSMVVLPLLILLALSVVFKTPVVFTQSAYVLIRLELSVAATLAAAALAMARAAKQPSTKLGSASVIVIVVCAVSAAFGSQPGVVTADIREAIGVVLLLASLTGAPVAFWRGRSAGYLAFAAVLFSAALAASWQVAVPPFIARIIVQH